MYECRGSYDVAFFTGLKKFSWEGEVQEVVVQGLGEAVNLSAAEIPSALRDNILYNVEAFVVYKRWLTKRVATMCKTVPLFLYFLQLRS
jgi:hypothetical protein